jgi:thiol:disulfide interchange protein DsbC
MPNKSLFLLPALFLSATALAGEAEVEQQIRAAMQRALPKAQVDEIRATPIPQVYEVMAGTHVFYTTADGRYALEGKLYDLETRENLTDARLDQVRSTTLDGVGDKQMIVFEPEKAAHTVTVFTDIDCGYCRKLHGEMEDYLKAGIRVRYMLYPRAGVGSGSYDKAVSVWCADDRNEALTRAKQGEALEQKQCANPVKEHLALGAELGVRGTPSIVTETGEFIPGYVPAARLAAILEDAERSAHN